MPIPEFVNNACQVRLGWDLNGEVAYNILNFDIPTPAVVNQGLAESVGTAVKGAFTTNWAPHCAPVVKLAKVGVRDLRTPHSPEFVDTGAAAAGSVGTFDTLPRAAAVCVTLRTALAGKSYRGRVYLPGASEGENQSTDTQSSAVVLSAVAFINDIASRLQPLNLLLGVLSRPQPEVILRRVTLIDGDQVEDRVLSHQTQKSGFLTKVISVESRNTRWEYQRRRDNARGQSVSSLLGPVASAQITLPA